MKYVLFFGIWMMPLLGVGQEIPLRVEIDYLDGCGWDRYYLQDYIQEYTQKKDSIILRISFVSDCGLDLDDCLYFYAEKKSDTLFTGLKYIQHEEGIYVDCPGTNCGCEHVVTYHLHAQKKDVRTIYFEKEDITRNYFKYKVRQEPTFEILNGDTINYTDQYGIERGLWLSFDSLGNLRNEVIMFHGEENGYYRYFSEDNKVDREIFMIIARGPGLKTIHIIRDFNLSGSIFSEKFHPSKREMQFATIKSKNGYLKEIQIWENGKVMKVIR